METDGSLFYSSSVYPSAELLNILRSHLREVPLSGTVKLYYTERDHLYSITAQQLQMNSVRRYLFYCVPSRIPLHTSRTPRNPYNGALSCKPKIDVYTTEHITCEIGLHDTIYPKS